MLSLKSLLATITVALADTASAQDKRWFEGKGQIRMMYNNDPYQDLGCLTSAGKWTVDEPLCGTFEGVWIREYNFNLTSLDPGSGPCGAVQGPLTFTCGKDVQPYSFGTLGPNVPRQGLMALVIGQYVVFATDGVSPPPPGGEPMSIRPWRSLDKPKWAWIGWKAL